VQAVGFVSRAGESEMSRWPRAHLACVLVFAGCATQQATAPVVETPAPVVADSLCEAAEKRTWSVKGSIETIREAQAWNRAIDKRCGVPGT
jgi:hypothetical protein